MPDSPPKRRLRVLMLIDSLSVQGGGEWLARALATRLDQDRFKPTLCVSRRSEATASGPQLEELNAAGVELIALDRSGRIQLQPWRRLLAHLRETRTDIVHTHKFGSNLWGALIAPRAGVPVLVAHEHGWSFEGRPLRRLIDRRLIARRADAVIAVSSEDRRRMIEVELIPASRIRLIENGIPIPDPPQGHDVRAECGIAADQPVVGAVATLRPEKALDVLISAAATLRSRFPRLRVLIAGGPLGDDTSTHDRLIRMVDQRGLSGVVTFLGHRPDVPDVLRALDVAVLCSLHEGSPLSVMEYMEAGLPVVASRVGGIPDLVSDGVTGLLVKPGDPEDLTVALTRLLGDPSNALQMGSAGRERRRQAYDIDTTVRRVEHLYEELYAAKRR